MGSSASRAGAQPTVWTYLWNWTSWSLRGRREPYRPHGTVPHPLLQFPEAQPPHLCNSLLSSSSASKWENPNAR